MQIKLNEDNIIGFTIINETIINETKTHKLILDGKEIELSSKSYEELKKLFQS